MKESEFSKGFTSEGAVVKSSLFLLCSSDNFLMSSYGLVAVDYRLILWCDGS